MSKRLIAALFLVAAVMAFRLLPVFASEEVALALANISPLAALALCGAMLLPRPLAAGVTFGTFLASDVILNLHYGQPPLNAYSLALLVAFAAIFAGGWALRRRASLGAVLGGTVAGTLLFYLVTNTASMFYDPGYAKSLGGWWQAMTVGLPGYPSPPVFGLRSLAGNLVFGAAFFLALRPVPAARPGLAPAPAA